MNKSIKKIVSSITALFLSSTIMLSCSPVNTISAAENKFPLSSLNTLNVNNVSSLLDFSNYKKQSNVNVSESSQYSSYNSTVEHGTTDLSDLNALYEHYDIEKFLTDCQELKTQCENNADPEIIISEFKRLNNELLYVQGLSFVSDLILCSDLINTSYQNENDYILNTYMTLTNELINVIKFIAENDYYYLALVEEFDENVINSIINMDTTSSDTSSDSSILNDYYQMISDKASEEEFADLYLQSVNLQNEYAQSFGYDNYIEYSYDYYIRDYTIDDATIFMDYVSEYISPICLEAYSLYKADENNSSFQKLSYTNDEMIEAVGNYIDDISPEMAEAYEYMKKYNTYSIETQTATNSRSSGAFTTFIPFYSTPYIFMTKDNNPNDITTLIHEFGHYNETYQAGTFGDSTDLSEISSQCLELLFMPYYSQIYGEEYADISEKYVITNILYAISSGAMVADFETQVYQNPDMTSSEVLDLFNELKVEYLGETIAANFNLSNISHIFEQPGYYISYSISGTAAFEIFNTSISDREQAISDYIDITKYTSSIGIKEALMNSEMNDIFEEDTIKGIAQTIKSTYLMSYETNYDVNNDGTVSSYDSLIILMITVGNDVSDIITDTSLADINGDGNVSSDDALMILQQITGLSE